jgi:hypothetical protein
MRRMKRVVLALALGSSVTCAAHAQSTVHVALSWSAPAGCPTQADVEADIARRLGRSLAADGAALEADAAIESTAGGYRLTLATELEGESGTRVLDAQRCDELASAASVTVALLADPHADATPAPAPKPPPPPQPEPTPKPKDDTAADDEGEGEEIEVEEPSLPSRPIAVHVGVRLELLADLGTLPKLGVGPALSVSVRLDQTALELTGNYLPSNDVESGSRTLGSVHLWTGALGVCQAFGQGVVVGPCLRAEYGRMFGKGSSDVRIPNSDAGMFAALWLGLRLDYAVLPALWLSGELAAGLPLARTIFTVQGVDGAHEPSGLIGRVRAGAELRF